VLALPASCLGAPKSLCEKGGGTPPLQKVSLVGAVAPRPFRTGSKGD